MESAVIPIRHEGEAGEARRVAVTMAARLGFSEEAKGKVALVATEAARNIALHAKQGEVIVKALDQGGVGGVELLALDKGPGMESIDACMRDGYTTSGTGGVGLGAISRLSDEFDIHSAPGLGTAVLARIWSSPPPPPSEPLQVGVVNVPKLGEEVCGDTWAVRMAGDRPRLMICDGLGHGPGAATAALEAVRIFYAEAGLSLPDLVQAAHAALRPTRGGALAIVELELSTRSVRYVGVGNIVSVIQGPDERQNLVSLNGTVGHQIRTVQEFSYTWPPGAVLVMHSDGVGTQWRLDRYPGLAARNPALVAGVLYRDFNRGRDDATVLVARELRGAA